MGWNEVIALGMWAATLWLGLRHIKTRRIGK
jgi:hypothetical protein